MFLVLGVIEIEIEIRRESVESLTLAVMQLVISAVDTVRHYRIFLDNDFIDKGSQGHTSTSGWTMK